MCFLCREYHTNTDDGCGKELEANLTNIKFNYIFKRMTIYLIDISAITGEIQLDCL